MLLPSYSSFSNLRVGSFNSQSTKYRETKKSVFSQPNKSTSKTATKLKCFFLLFFTLRSSL